jgi:Ribbon-helix-helix protein, copG family.
VVKIRFSVSVEREVVEKLDQLAKSRGLSRTKLVEKILAEYVGVRLEDPSPIDSLQKEVAELRRVVEELKKEVEDLKKEVSLRERKATIEVFAKKK